MVCILRFNEKDRSVASDLSVGARENRHLVLFHYPGAQNIFAKKDKVSHSNARSAPLRTVFDAKVHQLLQHRLVLSRSCPPRSRIQERNAIVSSVIVSSLRLGARPPPAGFDQKISRMSVDATIPPEVCWPLIKYRVLCRRSRNVPALELDRRHDRFRQIPRSLAAPPGEAPMVRSASYRLPHVVAGSARRPGWRNRFDTQCGDGCENTEPILLTPVARAASEQSAGSIVGVVEPN